MSAAKDERVRLRPGIAVIGMPDGVQLRCGDEEIYRLQTDDAEFVRRILAELQRPLDRAEWIARHGDDRASLVAALYDQLEQRRCLVAASITDDPALRFLRNVTKRVDVTWPVDAQILPVGHAAMVSVFTATALEQGFAIPRESNSAAPLVCLMEQPDWALSAAVNRSAVSARRPCLFVDLSHGRHATIGPFYIPDEGACYQCFRVRWRQNAAAAEEMAAADAQMSDTGEPLPAFGTLSAFRAWVAAVATAELVAFFTGHRPLRTLNQATTIDLEGFRQWTEPVWRVPWCCVCGRPR